MGKGDRLKVTRPKAEGVLLLVTSALSLQAKRLPNIFASELPNFCTSALLFAVLLVTIFG